MRAAAGSRSQNRFWPQKQQRQPSNRNCPLCKQAGRKDIHHFLSECTHLPQPDRRFMQGVQPKVRGTDVCDFDDEYSDQQHAASSSAHRCAPVTVHRRVLWTSHGSHNDLQWCNWQHDSTVSDHNW